MSWLDPSTYYWSPRLYWEDKNSLVAQMLCNSRGNPCCGGKDVPQAWRVVEETPHGARSPSQDSYGSSGMPFDQCNLEDDQDLEGSPTSSASSDEPSTSDREDDLSSCELDNERNDQLVMYAQAARLAQQADAVEARALGFIVSNGHMHTQTLPLTDQVDAMEALVHKCREELECVGSDEMFTRQQYQLGNRCHPTTGQPITRSAW